VEKSVKFQTFNEDYLNKSWGWLNDKEISYLIMSPKKLTTQMQQTWFQSLKTKHDYFIFGVEYNHEKIGVCGLKNVRNGIGEYWGYIGEKKYWHRGIGTQMVKYIIKMAQIKLHLNKVYLNVRIENINAIKLYEKLNFKITATIKKDKIDVLRMEIDLNSTAFSRDENN